MAVAGSWNQLPVIELVDLRPTSRDPLSEFPAEGPAREASQRFVDREVATGAVQAPNLSFGTVPTSNGRWFVGVMTLAIGLAAGFAGGVVLATRYGFEQDPRARSLASTHVVAELPRLEVPRSTDGPIVPAEEDGPRASEIGTAAASAWPPVREQASASLGPAEAIRDGSAEAVLFVQSHPEGAAVYLDDQLVTTAPFQLSGVALGRHTLRIELQGYRTWSAPISIEPGARIRITAALEP